MAQDQQTYQRGASAALAGLITQLALAVITALLGLWAQAPALYAAAWYLFGGLPIWFILIVLYHQHRLERAEALEVEQLGRTDAKTAALFDQRGDELNIARRRLNLLHKWGLGAVSAIVAVYLLGVGGYYTWHHWRLVTVNSVAPIVESVAGGQAQVTPLTRAQVEAVAMGPRANPIVLIAFLAGIGFIGFVVSRYVSGMTEQREWKLLRGGASYLMGNALAAVLLLIGAVFALLDNRLVMAYLSVLIPAGMALIGAENLFSFLLNAYRPRRPGEVARPAFDSRLLGWLTAPQSLGRIISETLNYQFGFEISRSWFYRLLGKAITPLIAFGLFTLVAISALVVVGPHEQAVVTRFGAKLDRTLGPGLHVKWPWPISRAQKYAVGRVHQISVGSLEGQRIEGKAILWTNVHYKGEEKYLVAAPSKLAPRQGETPTADDDAAPDKGSAPGMSLVAGEVVVQYRVADLNKFVTGAADPEAMLSNLADRRVSAYFATHDIDTMLTRGRLDAGAELKREIQSDADGAGLGLNVVYVGVAGIHPPQKNEVAAAFHEQIGAVQEKEAAIEKARQQSTETLAEVAGSRQKALELDAAINELERLKADAAELLTQTPVNSEKLQAAQKAIVAQDAQVSRLLMAAGGKSAEIILEALAYRWQRALNERAAAKVFEAQSLAYDQAPQYYLYKRLLEATVDATSESRKFVVPPYANVQGGMRIRLDLKDVANTLGSLGITDDSNR